MAEGNGPDAVHGAESAVARGGPYSGAVFISYASQDASAAERIAAALRAAGIEVWFDRSELRGGEAWDRQIRKKIHDCALFIPVVSAHTDARKEGYFRREWRLAVERTQDIADDAPFLVPVVIDGTPDAIARVPDRFREVQWTRLPDGAAPAAFTDRVLRLLSPDGSVAPTSPRTVAKGKTVAGASFEALGSNPAALRRLQPALLLIAACVLFALGYFLISRLVLSKHPTETGRVSLPVVQPASAAQNTIPEKSIAVLPFVDMSEKHDQEYFSDGLAEELIDMLTKIPNLRVPARTSSFYFKGKSEDIPTIARRLMVANVLEGSVRRSGTRLRVTAQLIKANDGYHLWSETYDRQLDDIFKVQDEIATAVVGSLKLKLLNAPSAKEHQTSNQDAYNQYLIGRQILSGGNWAVDRSAAEAFRRAVDLDPNYAPAWAGLAQATYLADLKTWETEGTIKHIASIQEALTTADKAVALAPDLAEVYMTRGFIGSAGQYDYEGSGEDFRRALALEPENSDVLFYYARAVLVPTGRLDEAVTFVEKALKYDPFNAAYWRQLGMLEVFRGDFRVARGALQRSLEINPEQSDTAAYIAYSSLLEGQPANARHESERVAEEEYRLQVAALAEHDLGRTKEAKQWLDDLIKKYPDPMAFQIAEIYAWWGDKDSAFQWLERAHDVHDPGVLFAKADPLLRSLRTDPRYKAFLRKMYLPE